MAQERQQGEEQVMGCFWIETEEYRFENVLVHGFIFISCKDTKKVMYYIS
jgi:hypothetical protein